MNKYYNKYIPTEINFVYGGRHSGRTYRETEKLINENKMLRDSWNDMFHRWEKTEHKINKVKQYLKEKLINEDPVLVEYEIETIVDSLEE